MRSSLRVLSLALLAAALAALDVGDKAPGLEKVTWLKGGAPVAGQPTVVEFWATWCGPCKVSIPHLSAIATKYAGKLGVVGLSDEDKAVVAPFIARSAMDYNVGLLNDPARAAWMEGVEGIPHAFVVGADGTVLWIGHPMELDTVVDQVVAGTFDSKAAGKLTALRKRLQQELTDADIDNAASVAKVLGTAQEIRALAPADEESIGVLVGVAQHKGDAAAARAVWESIPVAQLTAAQAAGLARTASDVVEVEFRHLPVALALARKAAAAEPSNVVYQETLARVSYASARIDEAKAAQQAAVKAAAGTPDAPRMQAILAFYEEVQRLRDAKPGEIPAPVAMPAAAPVATPEAPTVPQPLPILP